MNNRERYRFDDFTFENYRNLLAMALTEGYLFSDYEIENIGTGDQRKIVWRHDVEFSVHKAHKMALIESEKGVKAHYFFQLHSEFYNLLEKEILLLAKEIVALGHYIGLHFDAHFWEIRSKDELEKCLEIDKKILETMLEVEVKSFSFHNTTPELLSLDDSYYAGMLNVYARAIRDKYRYCADSTGFWRYERLSDVLRDPSIQYLQVLTHDGMWQETALAPRQRVKRCVDTRAFRVMERYDLFLKRLNQKNVDTDEVW
jgi:hypothetical protein